MIVLFDYDSMAYKSVYKITDKQIIKQWFLAGKSKEWMRQEIVNLSVNRIFQMNHNLFDAIENTGIIIEEVIYYLTNCKNSIRKKINQEYKKNRKPNKWVNMVRKHLIEIEFAITDDEYEADDLIADKASELRKSKIDYLILSLDKDLSQIHGLNFNYYVDKTKDENGNVKRSFRGLNYVTESEANFKFWKAVLTGDATDNIKGCKGIGEVKATRLLINQSDFAKIVKETFLKQGHSLEDYHNTLRLIGLGKTSYDDNRTIDLVV